VQGCNDSYLLSFLPMVSMSSPPFRLRVLNRSGLTLLWCGNEASFRSHAAPGGGSPRTTRKAARDSAWAVGWARDGAMMWPASYPDRTTVGQLTMCHFLPWISRNGGGEGCVTCLSKDPFRGFIHLITVAESHGNGGGRCAGAGGGGGDLGSQVVVTQRWAARASDDVEMTKSMTMAVVVR
jgi:hypothetical protein